MDRKMETVMIIENSKDVTGAFKSMMNAVNQLSDRYRFVFCIPRGSKLVKYLTGKYEFIEVPFLELSKSIKSLLYLPYLIINTIRIYRFLKVQNATIVHVNDLYNMTGVGLKLIHPSIGLIYHTRLLKSSYIRKLYNVWRAVVVKKSDIVIACSETVANELRSMQKIHVIYDSISTFEKYPQKTIASDKQTISLIYLSNFIRGKGHDDALIAFKLAYERNNKIRLRFIGGDMGLKQNKDFKRQLQQWVIDHSISDVVSFHDFESDVEYVLKESDIFLNFSHSESFSMTCLEALYYGIPVIVTNSGGPAELFEHGKSGYLVEIGNHELMCDAILKLSADLNLRASFSTEGRKFVINKFLRGENINQLDKVYRTLLN